jgi:penicillin-binding protein 1A
LKRLLQVALALAFLGALAAVAAWALFYALVLRDLPEINTLADYRPRVITHVYAADKTEIASFARERRVVVPIEDVPRHVKDAFVAAEDGSFYEHEGLDYPGILRAFWTNVRAGRAAQGGSTITQQVAKTFLLSSERKLLRKLKDMVLARRIEKALDKEEILYLYLNQIYLGSGAWGIEAAAQRYFARPARELSIAQAALIAGIVPRPTAWSPFRDPGKALRNQHKVLRRMVEAGRITEEQRLAAEAEPLEFAAADWVEREEAAKFFVEEARRYLVERYGEERVLTEGLAVYTTLDAERQLAAWRALRHGLRAHDRRRGFRGPIRKVPEAERPAALLELAAFNAAQQPGESFVHQGLVTRLDEEAATVHVALGPERETALHLSSIGWARRASDKRDAEANPAHKLSDLALAVGDVIWLEVLGEKRPEDPLAGQPAEYAYALYQEPLTEGSLLAVDLQTGELDAMVGGYSFTRSQFNRALQSRRQPGSAFKPVVYAAALGRGYTPATIVYDTPLVYVDESTGVQWKPENYTSEFYGPITLRWALAQSRNIATIQLMRAIGTPAVIEVARRLGIESPLENNLSLALGTSVLTLGELVRAYTAFAAGGRVIDPVFIREVRDREGRVLETDVRLLASQVAAPGPDVGQGPAAPEAMPSGPELERLIEQLDGAPEPKAVPEGAAPRDLPEGYSLDPVTAFLMTDMLTAVVEDGTGKRVKEVGRPIAGKTGTTNELYDAWFVGYTPQLAAGVWVGYDEVRNLGWNETGGRAAGPIFTEFMAQAHRGLPARDFDAPAGVVFVSIDKDTGLLACDNGHTRLFQPFREGTAPSEACVATASGISTPASGPLRLD